MTDTVDATPEAMDAPTIVLPDRADSPVSEVTERFLRAVVAQVPLDLIEELHLFSPLRQGTVETGIAVLAARVPVVVPVLPEPTLVLALEGTEDGEDTEGTARTEDTASTEGTEDGGVVDEVVVDAVVAEDVVAENVVAEDVVAEDVVAEEAGDDEVTADDPNIDSVVMVHDESVVVEASSDDEDVAVIEAVVAAPVPVVRHTVYTARYRYVIKGPERGKWEASVKAEADAPLVTVETVVRGVQRRAGEDSEIVRFTQAQVAKALRLPLA